MARIFVSRKQILKNFGSKFDEKILKFFAEFAKFRVAESLKHPGRFAPGVSICAALRRTKMGVPLTFCLGKQRVYPLQFESELTRLRRAGTAGSRLRFTRSEQIDRFSRRLI